MSRSPFRLVSEYQPTGDQPEAIETLVKSLESGNRFQLLEGVTGSGKTFTMANIIERYGRPTLLISHNKTLAAQLYAELKGFFPHNAVEYFVSYFDYYQPEAYIPQTDTFIEKDSSINEEIERLRLAATDALLNREDVIIVASVSCIYGLGSPEDYRTMTVEAARGQPLDRDAFLRALVDIQYGRNDVENKPGTFRVRGDTIDIFPSYARHGIRVELFGDFVDRIQRIETLTGRPEAELDHVVISPAKHFVTPYSKLERALQTIQEELEERVRWFEERGRLLEAQRIRMRTQYDLDMMRELGYCSGIENYSRHLTGRAPGERPFTLIDYFPGEFLTIIDESHATVPQIRGMYNGDRARKEVLVEHGFRLPSALDNRPIRFDEFLEITGPILFVSATPSEYERQVSAVTAQQIIRPTGLLDPLVEVRPLKNQIDDVIEEIRVRAERKERVLVTTLTKKTAEDLAEYLSRLDLRVKYIHSEIDAIERVEILRGLRKAEFDCLVGINLLREGLDLPEVSLVAILDADKEGFLRSETSLIQTAGRAARHVDGRVILYADTITDSMRRMIDITRERRERQMAYNRAHGITPRSIQKAIQESLAIRREAEEAERMVVREAGVDYDVQKTIAEIEREMLEAAERLEFERAALLRDQLFELRRASGAVVNSGAEPFGVGPVRYDRPARKQRGRRRTGAAASHAKRA
ncbi:MAG: excinuclease ABC subunit UvrB [Kiritimatiellae bacterium]|nr:excinuclease ABC subunit UvrB [Kiritimatiellia bacterium]MDW8459112.1 excinuclease ABC subunit UvrB [Verrucomicrobiota bacterium]